MTSITRLPEEIARKVETKRNDSLRTIADASIPLPDARFQEDMLKVFAFSDFVATACQRKPDVLMDLLKTGDLTRAYGADEYTTRIADAVTSLPDDGAMGTTLRQIRVREMIRIAWRDLSGRSELSETMAELSRFADACVVHTVNRIYQHLAATHGVPTGPDGCSQQFIVLAMGKLGACELNFSSDIDLIFLYPDSGTTRPSPDSHGTNRQSPALTNEEFFTRLARRFLKIFSDNTPDGILFRTDMRLRPYGESGPIVMSLGAFEDYLLIQGREWERYAFIKARMVAGDPRDSERVETMLQSFVYRRYLDYASFDSLREMKQNIVYEVKRKKLKRNIKLGSGGIREIEFFGQIFQLIRGGVEPDLRKRPIMEVLSLLAEKGHIPAQVKDELTHAYVFLRNTEHRLQEYGDAQTHDLPVHPLDQNRLAAAMGFGSRASFEHDLTMHMEKVHAHFDELLATTNDASTGNLLDRLLHDIWTGRNDTDQTLTELADHGITISPELPGILSYLRNDANTRALSREGRERLDKLMPAVLKNIVREQDAALMLTRIVDLVKAIQRRTCYIALLLENPSALAHLITLSRESPWIISYLSRHPVLLDELLDAHTLHLPPEKTHMEKELKTRLEKVDTGDLEISIETMCVFKQVHVLRVAASDVSGAFPLMKVSDYLTDIAESILTRVMWLTYDELTRKYGAPRFSKASGHSAPGFAIIGFGKLGGIEMGYGSDLDLVFVHGAEPENTTGAASIDSPQFYYRLGQKIIHALTARTAAGVLYEVDMRLRPSGNSGVIVTHIDAFADYYKESAWTFEHQALVRARPICGDPLLFSRFASVRRKTLCQKKDTGQLKKDIRDMREKMRKAHKPPDRDLFDLKQGQGGIVDIEFLVQYLVLKNAWKVEEITCYTDVVRTLQVMAEKNIIEATTETDLKQAYLTFRSRIHKQSLQEKAPVASASTFNPLREKVTRLWDRYLTS